MSETLPVAILYSSRIGFMSLSPIDPHELVLLRHAFAKKYNKSLDKEVLDDLSFKTKDAFAIILQGRWLDNGQVQPHLIEQDLNELLPAFRLGFTNEMLMYVTFPSPFSANLSKLSCLFPTAL